MSYRVLKRPMLRLLRITDLEEFRAGENPAAPTDPDVLHLRPSRRLLWFRLSQWMVGFLFAIVAELMYFYRQSLPYLRDLDQSIHVGFDQWVPGSLEFVAFAGTAVAAVIQYYKTHLQYDLRRYIIDGRQVRIRHGAWTIRDATYSIANIQNLQVKQGPLERLFGIARLIIETAGGGSHDLDADEHPGHRGVLEGLENAAGLRDRLQQRLRAASSGGNAGLGDRNHGQETLDVQLIRNIRDELRAISGKLASSNESASE